MQTTINQDTGLTDQQLRAADERTRAWYLRVLMLINETGCTMRQALQAVQAADKEQTERN